MRSPMHVHAACMHDPCAMRRMHACACLLATGRWVSLLVDKPITGGGPPHALVAMRPCLPALAYQPVLTA